MPEKKNNHIIPKCLLRQWTTTENNISGVYAYDQEKDKRLFSADGGKRAFSIAIESYYYVPLVNNERIYQLENWLGDIESTLARFIQKLATGSTGSLLKTEQEYHKLLLALFSLNTRTKFDIERIKNYLISNPELKSLIELEKDRDIEIAALENMMNSTIEYALQFRQCEIFVCKNESGNLILGDRPFLKDMMDGISFIPLHPHFFIGIKRSQQSPTYTCLDNIDEKMTDLINQNVAGNSNYWIISNKSEMIDKYIPYIQAPKNEVQPYYKEVEYLKTGYTLT